MTTIAYRDGVMAADSGAWVGNACTSWAEKLAVGSDGTLYGVSGNAAECESFRSWVLDGCQGEMPKPRIMADDGNSFIVLIAPRVGPIEVLTAHGRERYSAPYYAIGSGAEAAYGALFVGATATRALDAAVAHGQGAIGPVRMVCRPPEH